MMFILNAFMFIRQYLNKGEIRMRLSKFGGKEIVNMSDGSKLGLLEDADLLIDEDTGKIVAFIIDDGRFFKTSDKYSVKIPWENIKKIGNDIIIVDFDKDSKYN